MYFIQNKDSFGLCGLKMLCEGSILTFSKAGSTFRTWIAFTCSDLFVKDVLSQDTLCHGKTIEVLMDVVFGSEGIFAQLI